VSLPQYSGPGTITSVVLSISGVVGGVNFYPYLLDEGITVPSSPASWDVLLQAPDFSLVADAPVHTQFVGGTIPPCSDPACEGVFGEADFGPTPRRSPPAVVRAICRTSPERAALRYWFSTLANTTTTPYRRL
jgi:hypothetical protein